MEHEILDGRTIIFRVVMNPERYGLNNSAAKYQDMAEEYVVCEDSMANAGIIIYGKFNGEWVANPSARFLVRELLANCGCYPIKSRGRAVGSPEGP